jgi:hypothetical protein
MVSHHPGAALEENSREPSLLGLAAHNGWYRS